MINRSEIFRKAHFSAGLKRFWNKARPYKAIFADCLRYEYEQLRRRASWAAKAAEREALRDEQNAGLPVASCAFDRQFRRPFGRTLSSRFISAVGE